MSERTLPDQWIPVSESLPLAGQWYAGLTVKYSRDFDAMQTSAKIYLFRYGYPREHFPLPDNMTHWYPLPTPKMLGGLAIRHDIEEGEEQEFVTAGRIAPDLCVRARGYPIGIGGIGGFDAKS